MTAGHLQIVVCAASPAPDVTILINTAHQQSWTTAVTATPHAMDFIDIPAIEELTGAPVRSDYQTSPGVRRSLPTADALVIAPATYNSINKIALGLADNYAMTTIAELIGRHIPTVIVPFVNTALATRHPYRRAVTSLRDEGIHILLGPDHDWEPHPPGTGNDRRLAFPWTTAFHAAAALAEEKQPRK
ncbi:Flavoprotein [Micromonospora matsumotoense]|uniref:Flavoprotein n=1 Tax=Micromonospora matsumotoense TaxID=121616 RepID=A0A1C5AIZ4_9ACTN|nr:flavoprotein [Micromonospora matsumotoense]SCF44984.1 Flavoprotein [Micromonospora matsumotoense]